MNKKILASVAVDIAANALELANGAPHRCIRIKNLLDDEVIEFVNLWQGRSASGLLESVRLVVANTLEGRIPAQYAAADENTITYYRNHNKGGLIFLETEEQSDAQGLQNFFTLRDSNFLDSSFDRFAGRHESVVRLIAAHAWNSVCPHAEPTSMFLHRISQLIFHIHPEIDPVPIRKFVHFCRVVAEAWNNSNKVPDEQTADNLIGQCLWLLDLFPDSAWRDNTSAGKTQRRLEINARHADLRTTSGDVDADQLRDVALSKRFTDADGNDLDLSSNSYWRQLCANYIEEPSQKLLCQIPYFIFSQLFQKDARGVQLGDRIHQEIEANQPERLSELDSLDVIAGLNQRIQGDAERFLTTVPDEGKVALSDLISIKTRKMAERIAYPKPREFSNPLVETVRQILRFLQHPEADQITAIRLETVGLTTAGENTAALFTFLFGSALQQVVSLSQSEEFQFELTLAKELTVIMPPPPLVSSCVSTADEAEEASSDQILFDPLTIRWSAINQNGGIIDASDAVIWNPRSLPHMGFFWFLLLAEDSPWSAGVGGFEAGEEICAAGEDWIEPFFSRMADLSTLNHSAKYIPEGQYADTDRLLIARRAFIEEISSDGLTVSAINTFYDEYVAVLTDIRTAMIPNGAPVPVCDAILMSDTIAFHDTGTLLLPTHPFRLRWIARYLQESVRLLSNTLTGKDAFAVQDGEYYLEWLEERCPRELPPLLIDNASQILYPRSEFAWFEHFALPGIQKAGFGDDRMAISSVASRIAGYLDAHPYKRDGLSVLIISPPTDQTPALLLEALSAGSLRGSGNVFLTIATTHDRWEAIARAVEHLTESKDAERRTRLFPSRDLSFIEFATGAPLDKLLEDRQFDIGLVINVLDGAMQPQQNTEPPLNAPGHFDPLFDRTTRMEMNGDGGATSIVMRPRAPDIAIDTWGTLAVRANRLRPVSPSQPENTDFIELRLNFSGHAPLFNALHRTCHWVITLERHISRRQIESYEAGAPDVLSIEDGIGGNGAGTLIVSSRTGRTLIESRLARKISRLTSNNGEHGSDTSRTATIASAVYNETRWISPHLALTAMGISRVTEEILGLAVARALARQISLTPRDNGFEVWLSLDEHASWFGGKTSVRADLCRFSFCLDLSGNLKVNLLVVEGKLRQSFDPHGIQQASTTRDFFEQILGTSCENDSRRKTDSRLWRDRIFSAIDMCADQARETFSGDTDAQSLRSDIRAAFLLGNYELESAQALYSACQWDSQELSATGEISNEAIVIRSSGAHILPLITGKHVVIEGLSTHKTPGNKSMGSDCLAPADNDAPNLTIQQNSAVDNDLDSSKKPVISDRNRMNTDQLKAMYGEILSCFDAHGVAVHAASNEEAPIVEGPASILFKVRPRTGVDPKKLYEKGEALKLHLRLENQQSVAFGIDLGYVTIDVPKSDEQRYFVSSENIWTRWNRPENALAIPLGEDRFGQVVELNFSSANSPHLLIGGTTGSGKSEALNTILYGLVRHYSAAELQLLLIDPKSTELTDFGRFPHLGDREIGWTDDDAVELLSEAVSEMDRRYGLFRQARTRSLADYNSVVSPEELLPWWLIVLDEYADLTSDPQRKKEIEHQLKRLAQKARAAGIHVVIATQKPSAEVISTNLRSNLPAQLALRVKSSTESRVIMDETGAESLNGKGDAFLKAEGKTRRIQCARILPTDVT